MAIFSAAKGMDARERSWVVLISASLFFLLVGAVLYNTIVQTVVIKRAGVQYAPILNVVGAIATLAGSWLGLGPLRRRPAMWQTLFYAGVTFFGAAALGLAYLRLGQGSLAGVLAFGALGVAVSAFGAGGAIARLNNAQTDVFDVAAIQRVDPIMTSVAVGAILLAGGALAAFSEAVPTGAFFALAAVLIAAAMPFILLMRAKWNRETGARPPAPEAVGASFSLRPSRLFRRRDVARFVWLLGLIVGLSFVLGRVFGYGLTVSADARFATEQDLNAFYGWFTVAAGVVEIAFLNLLQLPFMRRYGLLRSLSLPPLVVIAAVALVALVPSFWIVVAAVSIRQVVINLQGTSFQAMAEGLSDYDRTAAWNWIEGGAEFVFDLVSSAMIFAVTFAVLPYGVETTVRVLAVLALAVLGVRLLLDARMRSAYPELLMTSLKEGDYKTRLRAAEALSELRHAGRRELGPLLELVRDAAVPQGLRVAALSTLGKIGDPDVLRVVRDVLRDPDDAVREEAFRTVAAFNYRPERLFESGFARHDLLADAREAFGRERRPEIVAAVLEALVALQDPDLVPFLLDVLRSGSASVRRSCLRSLRRFRDASLIDHVVPLLNDAAPAVRAQAIALLWQFPWERRARLAPHLSALLDAPTGSDEARQGLYLIGTLRLDAERPRVMKALASDDASAAFEAAVALLKFGDASGDKVLARAVLSTSDEPARRLAALVRRGELPKAGDELVRSLLHEHHLHYPAAFPVGEPLDARLAAIPEACLRALAARYAAPEDRGELRKIERELASSRARPAPAGAVALRGLSSPWREMAEVALLARGFELRDDAAISVAEEGMPAARGAAVLIGGPDAPVVRDRYAPSELVAAVRRAA
jgi:HEAT repeat protein